MTRAWRVSLAPEPVLPTGRAPGGATGTALVAGTGCRAGRRVSARVRASGSHGRKTSFERRDSSIRSIVERTREGVSMSTRTNESVAGAGQDRPE